MKKIIPLAAAFAVAGASMMLNSGHAQTTEQSPPNMDEYHNTVQRDPSFIDPVFRSDEERKIVVLPTKAHKISEFVTRLHADQQGKLAASSGGYTMDMKTANSLQKYTKEAVDEARKSGLKCVFLVTGFTRVAGDISNVSHAQVGIGFPDKASETIFISNRFESTNNRDQLVKSFKRQPVDPDYRIVEQALSKGDLNVAPKFTTYSDEEKCRDLGLLPPLSQII